MKPQKQPAPAFTAAAWPTWRCAAIPTLSGCRPWCRLPITFRFPPLPRERGRAAETHQKAACTWFFNVQAAFSDSVDKWGQAAFYALCGLYSELLARRPPAPSPVGEGRGEGFSGCLPTCRGGSSPKSGYGGDTPCSAFEFAAAVRICFLSEWERRVKTLQKAACTLFFAYNTPCPTLFHYSGNWI